MATWLWRCCRWVAGLCRGPKDADRPLIAKDGLSVRPGVSAVPPAPPLHDVQFSVPDTMGDEVDGDGDINSDEVAELIKGGDEEESAGS